jgi:hypothetical protein
MSRQQRDQQQALGAFLASQTQSITEEAVRQCYHKDSNHYKCDGCEVVETKEKKLLQCSRCKQSQYCSKKCQLRDWKEHKGFCKLISDASSRSMITEDSRERCELFRDKYMPMMGIATYCEIMHSAEEMIMIFELEDLPAECKAPRFGIKSFRQESIRSQSNLVQELCTESTIHASSCSRTLFALLLWTQADGEIVSSLLPFSFDNTCDDEDVDGISQARGQTTLLPRDTQIGVCRHDVCSNYIETINDMARGTKKNLSKAAKPRRR